MNENQETRYDYYRFPDGKGYAIIRKSDGKTIEAEYFNTSRAALKAARLRVGILNRQAEQEAA
jgi:hypothetical protein